MLKRKLVRDFYANKAQFISIFLLIFLGIFIYAGLHTVGYGMEQSTSAFYEETNLADAYLLGDKFTNQEMNELQKIPGIKKVEGRSQYMTTLVEDASVSLQVNVVNTNQISKVFVVEGKAFDEKEDGIWLDEQFAKKHQLTVGDSISYTMEGNTEEKNIIGLINHPEYVFALKDDSQPMPDHKAFGFAYVSREHTKLQTKEEWTQLLIKTELSKEQITKNVADQMHATSNIVLMRSEQSSVSMFQNEILQMKAVQMIFPIIFLVVAVLTILTTMTRITMNQRQQIGVMKALGFSNRRILLHYMSFGGYLSIIGSIIGGSLGIAILPNFIFSFQKTMYTLPEWKKPIQVEIVFVVVICIVACCLSGYFACKKELHGVAAEILRPKVGSDIRHFRMESSNWWQSRSFDFQWNVRDCLKNKLRVFITVFGIVGCMALILCALGMRDTVQGLIHEGYEELATYETKVVLEEATSLETMQELVNKTGRQFIMEAGAEITNKEETKTTSLTVLSDGTYIGFQTPSGASLLTPTDSCYLTQKLASSFGIKKGDQISFRLYGSKDYVTCEVANIIQNPVGQGIFIGKELYEKLGEVFYPTAFLTAEGKESFDSTSYKNVLSKEDMIGSIEELLTIMNAIIMVMIIAASLLGIVVLYNLGVLSFYERTREFATLKVLGFQYRRLQRLNTMQTIWLTMIGILIGLPIGYQILSIFLLFMGDSYDMTPKISLLSYSISILMTFFLSIVVNYILARKLKTIDMVSALKSVE